MGPHLGEAEAKKKARKEKKLRKVIEQRISDRLEQRIEERVARRMKLENERIRRAVDLGMDLGMSDDAFTDYLEQDLKKTDLEDDNDELCFLKAYEEQIHTDLTVDDMSSDDDESNDSDGEDDESYGSDYDGASDVSLSGSSLDSDFQDLLESPKSSDSDEDSIDRIIRLSRKARKQERDLRKARQAAEKEQKRRSKRSKVEILVEMVVTAMRSATVSLNMAGEKAVAAALTAVDLLKSVTDVVDTVDADLIEEASRLAKEREAEAAENDYSEDKGTAEQNEATSSCGRDGKAHGRLLLKKEAEQKKKEKKGGRRSTCSTGGGWQRGSTASKTREAPYRQGAC